MRKTSWNWEPGAWARQLTSWSGAWGHLLQSWGVKSSEAPSGWLGILRDCPGIPMTEVTRSVPALHTLGLTLPHPGLLSSDVLIH